MGSRGGDGRRGVWTGWGGRSLLSAVKKAQKKSRAARNVTYSSVASAYFVKMFAIHTAARSARRL